MHLLMIVVGLGMSWWIRCYATEPTGTWTARWQQALGQFLFPPLLLVMTAIAVLCMGPSGQMVWRWDGWLSYAWAIGFLSLSVVSGIKLAWDGNQTLQRIRCNPSIDLNGNSARLLNTSELYSARVGFWQPELVVSQGLIDNLDDEHLEAVLVHEQAHARYHDTFWFFWLGWIRRVTTWLPHTEDLWQELLMLRELRADRLAAQQVDPLVLAEALLMVVSAPLMQIMQPEVCAAFSWAASHNRLMERVDSLLANTDESIQFNGWSMSWLLLVGLPLVAIPFHGG